MKKLFLFTLLCLLPLQVFAISNFKINGAATYTVTSAPVDIVLTGDLAGNGNYTELAIVYDMNNNNQVDANELVIDYMILTDGIGWIRDPESPDDDIMGDETGVDGKFKTTMEMGPNDVATEGQFIFLATDENGSTATAILKFNIPSTPPYITGKVTDKQTGAPVPQIIVFCDNVTDDDLSSSGISDNNGDYRVSVPAGTYKVSTWTMSQPDYQSADTLDVTVGAGETKTVNIQLEKYPCFVEGYVKKENNSAVEGVMMFASAISEDSDFYNITTTNSSGYYKMGVIADSVSVGATTLLGTGLEDDEYVDPSADTLFFTSGQTKQSNFTVKKYTTTIEGVCKVNNQPLAGVSISGMAFDLNLGTLNFYNAQSSDDGSYKLGVKPGMVTVLTATIDGYTLIDPEFGYSAIEITQNQHLTGYDFTFQADEGGKSISGQVTYEDGAAANDVYVVAINDLEENKTGFLITYTDGAGNYKFENVLEGSWQIGVYKKSYHSNPYMQFGYIMTGLSITDANFVLLPGETGIEDGNPAIAPMAFVLAQNYPNPFNLHNGMSQTHIRFTLDQRKDIEISIFNIQGQLVKQVFSGNMDQGWHEVQWDGRDFSGNMVPTGTYFYRINTDNKSLTKQMVIIR